jgi:hypothetical protein
MKNIILAFVLLIASTLLVFSEDGISLTISKNSSGELILTVKGHTSPLTIKIGDQQIILYVEENTVNLTAMGINELTEVSVEEVDTAAGSEVSTDTQATAAPIPPISPFVSPNPPLSTPY